MNFSVAHTYYKGLLHNRSWKPPDSVVDFWHPLEKAQYPEYFARREQRKAEFIEMWKKTFLPPSCEEDVEERNVSDDSEGCEPQDS